MGVTPTAEQQSNADSIYNLIRYGAAGGGIALFKVLSHVFSISLPKI